ncbi:MAG: hypothetical protein E5299_01904 [Burkholderia gladioli]|nr:MAG: hypothetical protein E5299_01904 [Burkholderia gladioli]
MASTSIILGDTNGLRTSEVRHIRLITPKQMATSFVVAY